MIASDGGEMEGQWTGGVTTTVKQSLLTIPILAIYKVSKRWELELGPWFSYVTSSEFLEKLMTVILETVILQAKRQMSVLRSTISMMI